MPNLYVIAGCNGAGKTTASKKLLPGLLQCKTFVNADSIAAGLSPFDPDSVALEAGRIMLNRINLLIANQTDFAIETTLSTRSYLPLIKRAQEAGYIITLCFLWLDSPEMALRRVAHRVSKGGHNIPEEVVKRRYFRGIHNLINIYRNVCDRWMVFDNRFAKPRRIAEGRLNVEANVLMPPVWQLLLQQSGQAEAPAAIYESQFSMHVQASIAEAVYELVVETAALGGALVVGDGNGGSGSVPAIDLLEELKKNAIPASPHDTPAPY